MMIDTNVSVGSWPCHLNRPLTLHQVREELAAEGVTHFLPSAAECVLAPDPHPHNRRLIEEADGLEGVYPLPVINPRLRGWEKQLEEYLASASPRAVKVIPNYHSYPLQSGFLGPLVRFLAERSVPLVIQMRLDDERNHHVHMQVPGVPVGEIVALHHRFPEHPIICLNPYWREAIEVCQNTSHVYVDTAFAERYDTYNTLLQSISPDRILFGSHTPFLYTRSAVLKLALAPVESETRERIASANARRILKF